MWGRFEKKKNKTPHADYNRPQRISRYQKVIDRFSYLNIFLEKKPVLLILAESYEHMIQIQRLIPESMDFDIIYSYDSFRVRVHCFEKKRYFA